MSKRALSHLLVLLALPTSGCFIDRGGTARVDGGALDAGLLSGSGSISATGGGGPASATSWNSAGGDGAEGRVRVDYLEAGGGRFGSALATDYLGALSSPAPAVSARYLD